MQTFLASPNFAESARVLDTRRLGKQRSETMIIMKALTLPDYGWKNHPATKMWRGYEAGLMAYQLAVCAEWTKRGYRDTCLDKTWEIYYAYREPAGVQPPWLGDGDFHASHRSNLLRKLPEHYRQFWPDEPDDLPYVWPA